MTPNIVPLKDCSKKNIALVGGKAAQLGELIKIGMPVPAGFVITTSAFDKLTEKEITQAWEQLESEYVAVRSSATVEDGPTHSFAGEFESFPLTAKKSLTTNIKKVCSSLFTKRVSKYLKKNNIKKTNLSIAVIIQKTIIPDVAGVAFTIDPLAKNKNQLRIEAAWGMGESVVAGLVTPDSYLVKKSPLQLIKQENHKQKTILTLKDNKQKSQPISQKKQTKPKLNLAQILELSKLCIRIENHFKKPQDIEWALAKNKFYILQSRDVTASS